MHMVDAPDDAELLSRYAQARDEAAFAELVKAMAAEKKQRSAGK